MRFPVLIVAVFSISASAVPLQTEEDLLIESPAAGESVSGSVEILGSAAAPGMMRYRVEFAYDPNPSDTWFLISEGTEPVHDGLLAVWDTSEITEGEYALRVAAFFPDGSMREAVNGGIRVRLGGSSATFPAVEGITPVAPEPQTYGRPAAGFPAPTVVFASEPSERPGFGATRGAAFLIGSGIAVSGFALYAFRSRWRRWKRRMFLRKIRKGGSA